MLMLVLSRQGWYPDKVNTEPAGTMTDFNVSYIAPSGKWTLNGYVKNIEDHAQKTGLLGSQMFLNLPRTWGLVFSLKI